MHNSVFSTASDSLKIDVGSLPALIDLDGINRGICPMSRSLLYTLASAGEIESASLGMGRGKRVFITATVISWLQRRIAQSKRPNIAPRRTKATPTIGGMNPASSGNGACGSKMEVAK